LGGAFEQTLQRLQEEGQNYPVRFQQFAAVRFYLCRMLRRCEDRWYNTGVSRIMASCLIVWICGVLQANLSSWSRSIMIGY
jgi:hypothetical protein